MTNGNTEKQQATLARTMTPLTAENVAALPRTQSLREKTAPLHPSPSSASVASADSTASWQESVPKLDPKFLPALGDMDDGGFEAEGLPVDMYAYDQVNPVRTQYEKEAASKWMPKSDVYMGGFKYEITEQSKIGKN
jgi:hypothetical protein